MATTVYLIRHGQTDWNKNKIFRGRADVPLNAHGQEEARALSVHLAYVEPTACYSSPLSRAVETARIVAHPRSLEIRMEPDIIDIDYGAWQGVPEVEVKQRYADLHGRWHETPHRIRFPQGESLAMVRKRARASLNRIVEQNPGGVVFLVSHRVVTKVLMCVALGLPNSAFWRIRQDNCAYNVIEVSDNGIVVVLMNDTCHMKSAGIAPKLEDF